MLLVLKHSFFLCLLLFTSSTHSKTLLQCNCPTFRSHQTMLVVTTHCIIIFNSNSCWINSIRIMMNITNIIIIIIIFVFFSIVICEKNESTANKNTTTRVSHIYARNVTSCRNQRFFLIIEYIISRSLSVDQLNQSYN